MKKYRIKYYAPFYYVEIKDKWLWVFPVWNTVIWHWDFERIEKIYNKLVSNGK